jgi:outer membrane protein
MNSTSISINSSTLARLLTCVCLYACASVVHAQSFGTVSLSEENAGKDCGSYGGGIYEAPKYLGAKETRILPLPMIDYSWANGVFAGVMNGVGINFGGDSTIQYGPRLTMDIGRKVNLDSHLTGMGDIPIRLEAGGFFNVNLAQGLNANSSVQYGEGVNHRGATASVGLSYSRSFAERWTMGAGMTLNFANADYMQSYFGVDAIQAAKSGFKLYAPGDGLRDVCNQVFLVYGFSRDLRWVTAIGVSQLANAAKNSPLTQKSDSASVYSGLSYRF